MLIVSIKFTHAHRVLEEPGAKIKLTASATYTAID